MADPIEPAPPVLLEVPPIPVTIPLEQALPPGWELTTQKIRPAKLAPAPTASGIKPTAPVMAATGATLLVPLLATIFTSLGHPLPTEMLVALPTMFAFVGGWLHGDGRS